MNKIFIIGNLTKELELRYTTSNKAVTTLSVAINNGKTPNGEDDTTFLDFGVFGKIAENCCKYLGKGSKVAIEGLVKNNNYTDKEGKKIYSFHFIANNVEFLSTKSLGQSTTEQTVSNQDYNPYEDFGNSISIDDNFLD